MGKNSSPKNMSRPSNHNQKVYELLDDLYKDWISSRGKERGFIRVIKNLAEKPEKYESIPVRNFRFSGDLYVSTIRIKISRTNVVLNVKLRADKKIKISYSDTPEDLHSIVSNTIDLKDKKNFDKAMAEFDRLLSDIKIIKEYWK